MIVAEDLKVLAEDIAANGQVEPILLLDGKVLDGRNRQAACGLAGIKPIYADFSGVDPLSFVLSRNLHRRHLTESQRALVAAAIVDWELGINQNTADRANLPTHRAAKALSVSQRAVGSAKRIREHGAPELIEAIRAGKVSIHAGEAISELQHAEQARVIREEKKAIVAKAKEIRLEQQKVKHAVRMTIATEIANRGRETAPGKIERLFPIIYADPPWKFETHSEITGGEKSAENHYPTMEFDAICRLFKEIGDPATPDAMLYLWVTTPLKADVITEVLPAWGFRYVSEQIWNKVDIGTGYQVRDQHESLLIAKRGRGFAPLLGQAPPSLYTQKKGKHSAKPAWFAAELERIYPDLPKLELFCRSPRPGWVAWGYEAGEGE